MFLALTELPVFAKLILLGGTLVVGTLYVLSYIFPQKDKVPARVLLALLPLYTTAIIISFSPLIIQGAIVHQDGHLEPINGPLFPLFAVIFIVYIVATIVQFLKSYRSSAGRARLQIRYFFMGLGIFIVAAVIFDVILPWIGITELNVLGPMASLIFVGSTGYAIVRHQLLDIRIVIQRGIIYTTLFVLIIGLYLSLIASLGYLAHITADLAAIIAAGITTIIGIFTTPTIDRYLRKITDAFLFKDRYDYSEALYELSKILNHNVDVDTITNESEEALRNILRVSRIEIFSNSKFKNSKHIKKEEGELLVPISYKNQVRGCIIVGLKRSGDPFTKKDQSLLNTFAEQAGIALEKASLFREVESYSHKLEEKVRNRTAKIEKLQKDQEQMIIDISHQLQDPLTIAKLEIETIKEEPSQGKIVTTLEKSLDDISDFTYRLIRLARLTHSPAKIEKEMLSMSDMLKETVEYFEIIAQEKRITVMYYIEPDLYMYGNRKSLQEVVTNLLSNAIKYNVRDIKDKRIYVGLFEKDDNIVLTVQDTGIGIATEELPLIFNRFHKVKKDPALNIKSVGLGLSIVKRIVDLHGGNIDVLSAISKGATFTLSFPKKS